MKEWQDPYNSFNSYKGLLYKDQFDGIINGKFLPPVEVNIDPCNNCQLNCVWCNGKDIISKDSKVMMTKEHLLELVNFCKNWGVKAICFAGGGEPTLHPYLSDAIELTKNLGMEVAIITNGLFRDERQIEVIASCCRWIGISLDAGTPQTYLKLKGLDKFNEVLENFEKLNKYKAREITSKFLIHPDNCGEIGKACEKSKEYGATGFHTRILADRYLEKKFESGDYSIINKQLESIRGFYESESFKIFSIHHKQEGYGNRRINFNKCKASPLLCMLEANGDVSVCIDRKGDSKTRLCSHLNINELKDTWGSNKHKELLDNIKVNECKKCTMTIYQELYEAYRSDKFCMNFP